MRHIKFTAAPTRRRGREPLANKVAAANALKAAAARKTGPPPSTNISSPVAGPSKKRKAKSGPATFVDESDEEPDYLDSTDEEDENAAESDDAFEPIRSARPARPTPISRSRPQATAELGPPIARDARLAAADLNEVHQSLIDPFVEQAKETDEEIRNANALRRPLFTEQQFREMIIRWATTPDLMLTIPGVEPVTVETFGDKFARLVSDFHARYREMMGPSVGSSVRSSAPAAAVGVVVAGATRDKGKGKAKATGPASGPANQPIDLTSDGFEGLSDLGEDDNDDAEETLVSSRFFSAAGRGGPSHSASASVPASARPSGQKSSSGGGRAAAKGSGGSNKGGGPRGSAAKRSSGSGSGSGSSSKAGGARSNFPWPDRTTEVVKKRTGGQGRRSGGGAGSKGGARGRGGGSGAGGGIPDMPY